MDFFTNFSVDLLLLIAASAILAGIVKGAVGFAMPMVFISILTVFFDQELAIGILVVPTLIANLWQVFRQGFGAAMKSVLKHKAYIITVSLILLVSAQVVPFLPARVFFLFLGILIVGFTGLMLFNWQPDARRKTIIQWVCSIIAGLGGGIAGVWGPPTIVYLSTLDLEKDDNMRAQGGIFSLGGLFLVIGHMQSGVLNATTWPLSIYAIIPACIGMWLGFQVHDRIDQKAFRTATMVVLIFAGLNLIRRGVMG